MIKIFTALLIGLGVAGGTVAMAEAPADFKTGTPSSTHQRSFSKGRTIVNTSRRIIATMVDTCASSGLEGRHPTHPRLSDIQRKQVTGACVQP
jgi:hypothetical protein